MEQDYATKDDIKHLRELMEQYNQMAQTAIDKAEKSVDERLKGMNEFRAQQQDMIANFATKEGLASLVDAVNVRIDGIEKTQERQTGANRVIVIVATLAGGLIEYFITHLFK